MNANRLRSGIFAMSFLSSDDRVRRDTRALFSSQRQAELPFVSPVRTKLTAVSVRPQKFRRVRDAAAAFDAPMREAAAQGSPFVAFPELSGLAFLGLLPQFDRIAESLRASLADPAAGADYFADAVQTAQGYIGEVFFNVFSELARGHRMLIAAGGFYVREGEAVRNRQFLFSESGEVLLRQDKMILSPLERTLGVAPSALLTPADTRVGRVALLTGSCAGHCEPFLVAAARGCRIVVAGASPFYDDTSLLRVRAREYSLAVISPGIEKNELFCLPRSVPPYAFTPGFAPPAGEGSGRNAHSVTVRVDLSAPRTPDHYAADRNGAFFTSMLREKTADADEIIKDVTDSKNSLK